VGAPGARAPREVWITVERDVLSAFEAGADADAVGWADRIADPLGIQPDVVATPLREDRIPALSSFIHEHYGRCGGFMAHGSAVEAYEAADLVARRDQHAVAAPKVAYTIDSAPMVNALIGDLREINVTKTINTLSGFFTRYHNCPTGRDSALWIQSTWAGFAAGRADISVDLFNHVYNVPTMQPSVILTITGTTFPDEVLVLGAHQDSIIGSSSATNCTTARAPGADDDASGIASLTEVIRVAMARGYRPQRTVKFMAYAAEEAGLRGSNAIALDYKNRNVNVIGVLQFDMTNYQGTKAADIVFYQDYTHYFQNEFIAQLASLYVPTSGTYPRLTDLCGYGCSDHASWDQWGYPASLPFESKFANHSPFIHTVNDTMANSGGSARTSMPFVKLAAAYMVEIAKGAFVPFQQQ
jgi:leucyl aminopeptidase